VLDLSVLEFFEFIFQLFIESVYFFWRKIVANPPFPFLLKATRDKMGVTYIKHTHGWLLTLFGQ